MSAPMFCGRVADIGGGILGNVAIVGDAGGAVGVVLADLTGAEQQNWNGEQ